MTQLKRQLLYNEGCVAFPVNIEKKNISVIIKIYWKTKKNVTERRK